MTQSENTLWNRYEFDGSRIYQICCLLLPCISDETQICKHVVRNSQPKRHQENAVKKESIVSTTSSWNNFAPTCLNCLEWMLNKSHPEYASSSSPTSWNEEIASCQPPTGSSFTTVALHEQLLIPVPCIDNRVRKSWCCCCRCCCVGRRKCSSELIASFLWLPLATDASILRLKKLTCTDDDDDDDDGLQTMLLPIIPFCGCLLL